MVCLPADRDVTGGGIEVEFFGQKARMMGGPAALAVQTGAALLPAVLWFEGRGWGVHIYPEVPVPAEGTRRDKIVAMTRPIPRTGTCSSGSSPRTSTPPGCPRPPDRRRSRTPASAGTARVTAARHE